MEKLVNDFDQRMAPIEDAFMSYVHAYQVIGFGRMIQLIQKHWDEKLKMQREAYINAGNGKGYSEVVP